MSYFARIDTPINVGLVVVPQQMAYVVERFGRYHTVLEPGLRFLVPLVHKIRYVFSLKEEALTVPSQTAVTRDNVNIGIDGVLYVKVVDAYKAAYGVEDPHFAITQLAQTTMRSEIGKLSLDETFLERSQLNANIVEAINAAAEDWGIACLRYEIRDIAPPHAVRSAMEMQAEAERRKRALILDSQGEREAEVNLAEGKKVAAILASEAVMQERINLAKGEAAAIEAHAAASANAVMTVATALRSEGGHEASTLRTPSSSPSAALRSPPPPSAPLRLAARCSTRAPTPAHAALSAPPRARLPPPLPVSRARGLPACAGVAEQYVAAFKALAASGSTVVVPANTGDVGSMVAQAMAIYRQVCACASVRARAHTWPFP